MRIHAYNRAGEQLELLIIHQLIGLRALGSGPVRESIEFTGKNFQELTDRLREAGWCMQHIVREGILVIDE